VDRAGKAVARFEPDVPPNSAELATTIEQVLAGTFKPAQSKGEEEEKKAGGEQRQDPRR
jgi:hypothetical protein